MLISLQDAALLIEICLSLVVLSASKARPLACSHYLRYHSYASLSRQDVRIELKVGLLLRCNDLCLASHFVKVQSARAYANAGLFVRDKPAGNAALLICLTSLRCAPYLYSDRCAQGKLFENYIKLTLNRSQTA